MKRSLPSGTPPVADPMRLWVMQLMRSAIEWLPRGWRMRPDVARIARRLDLAVLRRLDLVRWRVETTRDAGAKVGDNCRFYSMNIFSEPHLVEFGDDVLVSGEVAFVTHDGSVYVADPPIQHVNGNYGRIRIGSHCFIGMRALILQGVEIGDNCIVAAGAVVMDSFPANSVIAGNPATYVCPTSMFMAMRRSSPATIIDPAYPGPDSYPAHLLLERVGELPFRPVRRRPGTAPRPAAPAVVVPAAAHASTTLTTSHETVS